LLALVGLAVSIYRRRLLPWVVVVAALTVLYVATSSTKSAFISLVALPWYGLPERIAYNIVLLLPLFCASALLATADATGRWKLPANATKALIALVAFVALVLPGARVAVRVIAFAATHYVTIGDPERDAFAFMAAHINPNETVLTNENRDGSLWMYAYEGVTPVFLNYPAPSLDFTSWKERRRLAQGVSDIGDDPEIGELLERFSVRFVYFDDDGFPAATYHFTFEDIQQAGLCLVYEQYPAYVFTTDVCS
jgi:hypothetical protein